MFFKILHSQFLRTPDILINSCVTGSDNSILPFPLWHNLITFLCAQRMTLTLSVNELFIKTKLDIKVVDVLSTW